MFLDKKVYHFYHIYADGQWQIPLSEHIDSLKSSGLIEVLDEIKIGVVGTEENLGMVEQYLKSENIQYKIISYAKFGWEQVTLSALQEFAFYNNGYVFYGHSKGSSYPYNQIKDIWRYALTYFNIYRWKECILALEKFDTAGCFWIKESHSFRHYAGNFWWTTLEYIKKIPVIEKTNKYDAERWIGSLENTNAFSFKNTEFDSCTIITDQDLKKYIFNQH